MFQRSRRLPGQVRYLQLKVVSTSRKEFEFYSPIRLGFRLKMTSYCFIIKREVQLIMKEEKAVFK